MRTSSRGARDREDSRRFWPPGPYGLPACEARDTVSVRASIASTPPSEVGGVATFQDLAVPRAFDSLRSIRASLAGKSQSAGPSAADLCHGFSEFAPESLLKAGDGLGCDPPPQLSFPSEAESEKLPLPGLGHGAFRLIDLEFETVCDEALGGHVIFMRRFVRCL